MNMKFVNISYRSMITNCFQLSIINDIISYLRVCNMLTVDLEKNTWSRSKSNFSDGCILSTSEKVRGGYCKLSKSF